MLNKELHLFIFEGKKSENIIFRKLEKCFFKERFCVKCVYDAEIYQLYKQLSEDDFSLDVVNLLKERNDDNAKILSEYNRDSFAYIYLFFDYDAHATHAEDDKLAEMLSFFDNETDRGKLYISYPMVEAIRHFNDMESFKSLTVKCKRDNCPYINNCSQITDCLKEPHYKNIVSNDSRPQLSNVNGYDFKVWQELIIAHLCKMNDLVKDSYTLPDEIQSQFTIFDKQLEKHINHKCPKVAVLSAFPIFVLDYFGCSVTKQKLEG